MREGEKLGVNRMALPLRGISTSSFLPDYFVNVGEEESGLAQDRSSL
jgi:hypothetical protein